MSKAENQCNHAEPANNPSAVLHYYVVLRRLYQKEDFVSIYDESEAISLGWITEPGRRVWVIPPQNERTPTFVWEFTDIDKAIAFFEALRTAEIGIPCAEV